MVNSKTQPRLNLGRNMVYVGVGDNTESIVFWPDLENDKYKSLIVEEKNMASLKAHPGYFGVLHPTQANEDAYVVYRIDAPNDLTRLIYGGRFFNRAPKSRCDLLYSLDGKAWTPSWSLTQTQQPWDVIHYETVDLPRGNRSVWIKYLLNSPSAGPKDVGCGLYAVRMEANHLPADPGFRPLEVTFAWSEVQKDYSRLKRSHTQRVDKVPFTYPIHVGGEDHPVMESLSVNVRDTQGDLRQGYSDGKGVEAEKS